MADRLAAIEKRLDSIERRLSLLETAGGEEAPLTEEPLKEGPPQAVLEEDTVSHAATHLGRVLLIFGGAYFLRAVTDMGFLPTQAGIPLGMAYALIWLFLAWRAGGLKTKRTQAMLFGGASVLLMLPILVEAVTRFKLLSGGQSAAALAVFCAVVLAVAISRNLRSLAWLVTLGVTATAAVLLRASATAVPFAALLAALGLSSLWIVHLGQWRGLQWIGATAANLTIILIAVLSRHGNWMVDPLASYVLALALWLGFFASFAVRSHMLGREPGLFEVVESFFAITIGVGITLFIAGVEPVYRHLTGILALGLGINAYALAFTRSVREERGRSFYFYSGAGIVQVIAGSALLLTPEAAAAIWAGVAVVAAWISGRQSRVSLSLQCAVFLVAAGTASGALAAGVLALVGDAGAVWPHVSLAQWLTAAAGVACLFVPVAQRSDKWGIMAGLPQLIVLVLAVWVVGGLVVAIAGPIVAGAGGAAADLGVLAAIRTGVLSASAVVLALSSRHRRWPEARWLAYPVLVAVGAKLVFEDFPHGRPVTLFLALGFVGGALILVSRFMQRKDPAEAAAPA